MVWWVSVPSPYLGQLCIDCLPFFVSLLHSPTGLHIPNKLLASGHTSGEIKWLEMETAATEDVSYGSSNGQGPGGHFISSGLLCIPEKTRLWFSRIPNEILSNEGTEGGFLASSS